MRFLLCPILLLFISPNRITVPAGTDIQIRLTNTVSSDQSSGQTVTAVVVAPVFVNGVVAIDFGTTLQGRTSDASAAVSASNGITEQPAKLRLHFDQIQSAEAGSRPLSAVLSAVDNARESVDNAGLITGIKASETYEARIDQGLNKLSTRNEQLAQILTAVEGAIVKKVDPSITYQPGTDMTLKLTHDLNWVPPSNPKAIARFGSPGLLVSLVNAEPFRTVALKPPSLSDMTNLMFIGTLDQISNAFQAAGWFPASALGADSKWETARAIIENRGYSEAPMSMLTLEGQPPILALQKQTDTFSKRHHIRIWARPGTFDGKPVFVAAATHDTSISFSPESRNFTHGIDPYIDKERSKVVTDIVFTQLARAFALVPRPAIPKTASNATGDKLITDGQMAVLEF